MVRDVSREMASDLEDLVNASQEHYEAIRIIFGIPTSSAAPERTFSFAGNDETHHSSSNHTVLPWKGKKLEIFCVIFRISKWKVTIRNKNLEIFGVIFRNIEWKVTIRNKNLEILNKKFD